MTRPTVDPDWATTLSVDPTSGQNNRVEPPTAWKTGGFSYQEKPARNYMNFVLWNAGQWIEYLDSEAMTRSATYVVAANDASAESKLHADAVCDGTDDHTEINAAITAVSATGGIVLLTEGTFVIDGIISMAAGVHLRGMGRGATTIKVDTSSTTDLTILSFSSISNSSVRELTIDGSASSVATNCDGIGITDCTNIDIVDVTVKDISYSASAGRGILAAGATATSVVRLDRVYIDNCEGLGIQVTSVVTDLAGSKVHAINCTSEGAVISGNYCRFTDSVFSSNGNDGIRVGGDYCRLVSCTANSNANEGFEVASGGDHCLIEASDAAANSGDGFKILADYCRMKGCRSDDNTGGDGIEIGGTKGVYDSCVVVNNHYHGINFAAGGDENIVKGCLIKANGQATHNTYSGIYFASGASDNTVTDCKVRDAASSPQQAYGLDLVNVTSGTEGNKVYGNDLSGGGVTAAINCAGAGGTGTAKTIPAYIGSTVGGNVLDDASKANRIT